MASKRFLGLALGWGFRTIEDHAEPEFEARVLRGITETLRWWLLRHYVVTHYLKWAFDPDLYDFQWGRVRNVGVFSRNGNQSALVGGVRLIVPWRPADTLLFGEPCFREMITVENREAVEDWVNENLDLVFEATRLIVIKLGAEKELRRQAFDQVMASLYHEACRMERPFVLMVTNGFMRRVFERYNFALKTVGAGWFASKNKGERKHHGEAVPHYVTVLNLAESEMTVSAETLAKFTVDLNVPRFSTKGEAFRRRVPATWDSLPTSTMEMALEPATAPRAQRETFRAT